MLNEQTIEPSEVVKIVSKPETIIRITTGELKGLKETIESELNYRENKRKQH